MLDAPVTSETATITQRELIDAMPYTGPGTLAGKYLRQFWQPVAEAKALPVGRATKITVMSEDFTLYRGEDGVPHVVAHRCPHRGTQLSAGYVEGNEIRCIYHGWKFAGNGTCTERPGEVPGGEAKSSIKAYPTHEYLGLIFTYFGEGEAPSFPPFGDFSGEGIIETNGNAFNCNYFQSWENDWDIYHAKFTHRTGELHVADFEHILKSEKYEEVDYGVRRELEVFPGIPMITHLLLPATVRLYIPTFNEQRRRGLGPQFRQSYIIHVPIDDHSHNVFLTQMVPVTGTEAEEYVEEFKNVTAARANWANPRDYAAQLLTTTKNLDDVRMHPMFVEIEDMIAQCGQGTIADRHAEKLGRTDVGVVLLRRIFTRELKAIAEGRPTKNWAFLDLQSTMGI